MSPQTHRLEVVSSQAGYIGQVARALVQTDWVPQQAPANGRLLRNRQLIVLRTPHRTLPLRILVYKVAQSGRGRGHERRVEITSTYSGGLEPKEGYSDIVLGYDVDAKVFVGLDPDRLRYGGETSNASSFLETRGLRRDDNVPFVILLRQTRLFPEGEYQAFFRPERISEYLMNHTAIHSGAYETTGVGEVAPLHAEWDEEPIGTLDRRTAINDVLVLNNNAYRSARIGRLTREALTESKQGPKKRHPRQFTPEELRAIQQRQEENGVLGEQFVFTFEKQMLTEAGRADFAARVDWVSKRSVGEGYDISSFDPSTEEPRFIEVKSSEGSGRAFEISANEWNKARELGRRYCIYRVINVRSIPAIDAVFQDPVRLEREGHLEISPSGWRVTITPTP